MMLKPQACTEVVDPSMHGSRTSVHDVINSVQWQRLPSMKDDVFGVVDAIPILHRPLQTTDVEGVVAGGCPGLRRGLKHVRRVVTENKVVQCIWRQQISLNEVGPAQQNSAAEQAVYLLPSARVCLRPHVAVALLAEVSKVDAQAEHVATIPAMWLDTVRTAPVAKCGAEALASRSWTRGCSFAVSRRLHAVGQQVLQSSGARPVPELLLLDCALLLLSVGAALLIHLLQPLVTDAADLADARHGFPVHKGSHKLRLELVEFGTASGQGLIAEGSAEGGAQVLSMAEGARHMPLCMPQDIPTPASFRWPCQSGTRPRSLLGIFRLLVIDTDAPLAVI
mmetsp:Transcript_66493/g.154521  ORF Transcript_66493/g.154521 Transcript_66493/m.154521 type:complete len:337 (-) Transcript_66493:80-1090(-)